MNPAFRLYAPTTNAGYQKKKSAGNINENNKIKEKSFDIMKVIFLNL